MRPSYLLVIAGLLPSAGCSALVALSGTDLAELKTREGVHRKLGEPVAAGTAEGVEYEEFFTRRKIADRTRGGGLSMGLAMTFGLGEFLFFPHEVYVATLKSLEGQRFRVEYDPAGGVRGIKNDKGFWVFGCQPTPTPDTAP